MAKQKASFNETLSLVEVLHGHSGHQSQHHTRAGELVGKQFLDEMLVFVHILTLTLVRARFFGGIDLGDDDEDDEDANDVVTMMDMKNEKKMKIMMMMA